MKQTKNKARITSVSKEKTSPASAPRLHASKQILIDVDDLTVGFGAEPIIKEVSFCIHSGEFIGLIGPNGAGKTTFAKETNFSEHSKLTSNRLFLQPQTLCTAALLQ